MLTAFLILFAVLVAVAMGGLVYGWLTGCALCTWSMCMGGFGNLAELFGELLAAIISGLNS